MFQLIYELRKNWRGRVDGTEIEGCIRGLRGPTKLYTLVYDDSRQLEWHWQDDLSIFLTSKNNCLKHMVAPVLFVCQIKHPVVGNNNQC